MFSTSIYALLVFSRLQENDLLCVASPFIDEAISPSFNHLLLHYLKFSLRLSKLIIRQIYVAVYKLHMKNYEIQ